ncbi:PBP1A family penicillin-binding protein [Amphibacillus sp. MSJ-3]|uniref:PBP1A family penicillin-binding protein n=1 Tax=Amphibacillus sp. MSJ-3 TaxID=2841505 RepID=UPI001C0EDD62|nr:PBP1A family penicillin-binding protein [Amphibacillus sp. MSJ-3]MBU5594207.1 PBP1A family penicillin-binding protein [Amphibacillus sp. MSJ-3]
MVDQSQSRVARRQAAKKAKKNKTSIWKKIGLLILGLFIAVAIFGIALFSYYIFTAPKLDHSLLTEPASTKVYDINEDLFGDLGQERRTKISYEDLPDSLINAVLATEDVRFFKHSGIDIRRITKAVISNLTNGFGSEGGSTITQQVVKRSLLTPEKTMKRKVQEQWLALQLERAYEKEEILEMYLNNIYYGGKAFNGAYGIATAAEMYFGITDLEELTLSQTALLAGLPQRPSAYDPTVNPDLAQERMNTVLSLMVRHGNITQEEADEAAEVNVEDMLNIPEITQTPYQAFIDQVRIEVEEKLGADIYNDGLEIYTTLDPDAQEHVEYVLSDESPIAFPDDELQSGLVVLDTKTGAIQAIGGGRNRETGGFNMAIQAKRQPGSAIKPILSFGPAIEYLNWSTYQQIDNSGPFEIAGSSEVKNWNSEYGGHVSARYALQQSLNVPTLHTLEEVGIAQATEFAEGIGVPIPEDGLNIRDGIGGSKLSMSALDMAGAYSAFGNDGIYNEPYAVTKVVFGDGREENLKSDPVAAMSDATAYMVTDMLRSVVQNGTGAAANIPGLPMVGKTGTTDNNVDIWFTGYTTNYTVAVWSGYEDSTRSVPSTHTTVSRQLFKNVMTEISEGVETADFEMPDSVVRVEIERGTNPPQLPSEYTPDSQISVELFKRGYEPKERSEQFDKLDPVTGLVAEYDEEANQIEIKWDHSNEEDVNFIVKYGKEGSTSNESQTSDHSFTISQVEQGVTYTIEVIAVNSNSPDLTSEAKRIEIRIPEVVEEEPEEEEEEEPDEPDESEEPDSDEDNEDETPIDDENNDNNEENSDEDIEDDAVEDEDTGNPDTEDNE